MSAPPRARVLARSEHSVSRRNIDPDALKILYRLHHAGYLAYLVGGGVRDLLLGRVPKDFDIGTDAPPEAILDLFRNSRVIGRRFPIVQVMFGRGKVFEVATFRALDEAASEETDADPELSDQDTIEEEARLEAEADRLVGLNGEPEEEADEESEETDEEAEDEFGFSARSLPAPALHRERAPLAVAVETETRAPRSRRGYDRGRHLLEFADQRYGSPAEDAWRRDLTINGLFYDIADFSVIDYVGGLADLEAGVIRSIGDADERFQGDPVRMIRALRHGGRTGFRIEPATWDAILRHRERLADCSKARVLEEFYRDLRGGAALPSLGLMHKAGLLGAILPALDEFLPPLATNGDPSLPWRRLALLDEAMAAGEEYSNGFLLALLLAFPLLDSLHAREDAAGGEGNARVDFGRLAYRFLKPITARLGVARRDTEQLFLIALSQRRLARCLDGQPVPAFLRNKPYFSEAYRLFTLDTEARGLAAPPLLFGGSRRRSRRRRRRRRSPAE
jgi:poly(A) polymerase